MRIHIEQDEDVTTEIADARAVVIYTALGDPVLALCRTGGGVYEFAAAGDSGFAALLAKIGVSTLPTVERLEQAG